MQLVLRRIIFYVSTVVFLVTAPLIIGYTAGYRYHFKQHRIVKTGGLFVATDPKDATIEINGTLRNETSPASILNLTPGDYDVRVTKNGYWPWAKRLPVESERMTFASAIVLFKNQLPTLVKSGDITDAALTSRDNTILYRSGDDTINEVWMQRGTSSTLLWRSSGKPRTIGSMTRAGNVLMVDGITSGPVLISPDKNVTPFDLSTLAPPPFLKPLFDLNDQNIVYGLTKGTLTSVNTKTRVVRPIAPEVRDYLPTKDGILVISEKKKPELLRITGTTTTRLAILEPGATELFEPIGNLQAYWDSARNETVLLDLKKSDLALTTHLPGKIIAATTATDDTAVITATDHEIWRTVLRSNRSELITRVSDPLVSTYVHPSGSVIIYATNDRVRAVELDDRDARGIYDLANFDHIDSTVLSRDGVNLLIAGTREGSRGLWQLTIR